MTPSHNCWSFALLLLLSTLMFFLLCFTNIYIILFLFCVCGFIFCLSSVNVLTLFEYLNTNQKWKIQTENYLCSHLLLRFKIRQCVYFVCVCLQKSSRTLINLVYFVCMILLFLFLIIKIWNKRNEFCIYIYRFYIGGSIIIIFSYSLFS